MEKRKMAQRATGAVLSAPAFSGTAELPLRVLSDSNSLCCPRPVGGSYHSAVAWAGQNVITGGIGSGDFGPNANCTRARIVTVLYRANQ